MSGSLLHRRLPALPLIALLAMTTIAQAEGFRIETRVYVGDRQLPASEATTLFLDGVVYDFLAEPAQVAVFRKPGGGKPGRFILLDPEHRTRTELTTDQLCGAMDKLRTWAGRQTDPFLQFAADPQFKESFEPESGKLVLTSFVENYQVDTAKTNHPAQLAEYREFLDWYTRLGTLLAGGPPPEPRLRLNAALARHDVIPLRVELTRAGEKQRFRSEHDFTWRLSREDMILIDDVRKSLTDYREVSNDEFLANTRPQDDGK
jgi:hypothetical protein